MKNSLTYGYTRAVSGEVYLRYSNFVIGLEEIVMLEKSWSVYETRNGDMIENLQFYDCCVINEKMYFSAQERNGLFCYDKNTEITSFIMHFELEDLFQKNMHCKVIKHQGKMYFIPHYGHCLHIIDIQSFEQKTIMLVNDIDGIVNFSNAFFVGNYIWLIPSFEKCQIIKYDIYTEEYDTVNGLWEIISDKTPYKDAFVDIFSTVYKNGNIYISLMNTNIVVSFDVDNCTFSIRNLGEQVHARSISIVKSDFWITLVDSYDVVRVLGDFSCEEIFTNICSKKEKFPLIRVQEIGENIVALAGYDDRCFKVNWETKSLQLVIIDDLPKECVRITPNYALFTGVIRIDEENYYLLPRGINRMLVIDKNLQIKECTKIAISVENISCLLKKREIRFENLDDNLTLFCLG